MISFTLRLHYPRRRSHRYQLEGKHVKIYYYYYHPYYQEEEAEEESMFWTVYQI
jgi:hypothetical protein